MANSIWVVLQQRDGVLHKMSFEAIRAGQELAAASGGRVSAVLLGSGLDEAKTRLAQLDLAEVLVVEMEALANYTPGGYTTALKAVIEETDPSLLVFPHTYQTVDYAPQLALALDAALIPEATAFTVSDDGIEWTRPILGGKMIAKVRAKSADRALVSIQSGSFSGDEVAAGSAEVRSLEIDPALVVPDREILGVEEAASEHIDLSQSDYIVGVGRGIGDPENLGIVEDLAKALGAEIAASRPVIDNGWLPRDRQVGSSGQTVSPKLYLAAGISGAIQHLVGMKGSQVIVAINKDPGAPIFNVAHYGIVGDLHEIVPALTAAVNEAKSG
ncbi:MAG: electron transfer flavoprotein subunit alpha/FixB family protein [Acidobacteriota bacterium]